MTSRMNWWKATRREVSRSISRAEREEVGAARRRDRESRKPTAAQIRYIESLARELDMEPPVVETRDGASALINELKRRLG